AMQPMRIEAGFIAGNDANRFAAARHLRARLRQQLRQRFQIPSGYRVPAELLGPWQQKAKLPSRFAQFKDQVNRGILCRGGRASVIGIGHLDPPRLDGCWKSDPNLLAARRPIVSEVRACRRLRHASLEGWRGAQSSRLARVKNARSRLRMTHLVNRYAS